MAAKKKGGLGKGLDALFIDNSTSSDSDVTTLKITEIEPNKNQPRKTFDEASLNELADSILKHGVLQPLVVRPKTDGSYQLVAGERRWRASRRAGLDTVPVIIKEMTDLEASEIALIENLQREDLNPVEEALGYRELMNNFNLTQDDIAQRVGKSRPVIANALRLLKLPEKVLDLLSQGKISQGHARALAGLDDEDTIISLANKIVSNDLTVRDVERLIKQSSNQSTKSKPKRETYYDELEIALKQQLGRNIKISVKGNKGTIQINFKSKEDLADIASRLANEDIF